MHQASLSIVVSNNVDQAKAQILCKTCKKLILKLLAIHVLMYYVTESADDRGVK